MRNCEESLLFSIFKGLNELLIILFIGVYFLLMYYLDKNENYHIVLIPLICFQFTLLLMVIIPQCGSSGVKKFFEDINVVIQCSVLLLTVLLDIYETSQDFGSRIHILVGFARVSRLVLFSLLVSDLEQSLADK